jgi:hypothetical protein
MGTSDLRRVWPLLLLFVAAGARGAEPAATAVRFDKVEWLWSDQAAEPLSSASSKPRIIPTLQLPAQARLTGRLWADVTVAELGAPQEAILLRYSVSAEVVPLSGKAKAVWSVPFMLDESRIPKMVAGKSYKVHLETTGQLLAYLHRLYLAGFWVKAVKLDAAIEPHLGDAGPVATYSSVLEVSK